MEAVKNKTVNRAAIVQKPAASVKQVQRQVVTNRSSVQMQTSTKVSSPNDAAEKEADTTSKKIMRMAIPESSIAYVKTGSGGLFRQVKREEKEKKVQTKLRSPYISRFANSGIFTQRKPEETIHRKADGQSTIAPSVSADIQNSMSSGSPLPMGVRRFMEPRFRADFSKVKIHTGDQAAKLNKQVNAQAFAMGNHVFFGKNKFQPESHEGKELIAHELTHTIQQGEVVQRSEDIAIAQQSPPQIQRLGLSDALDYFADKANLIPGFRMFTIVLGVNPINMNSVDRSAANIMRAIVEFIPGGGLITQALDNHGVFEKVGNWVEPQIKTLGMVGSAIKQAVTQFLDSLGWRDILDLGGVWNRAKSIFTDPINRIISFAKGLITGILKFVKDAILKPLAALAQGTRGYDLPKAILGEDPVTGEAVPRNADTLIGGFMKLIGQEEVWENIKKGKAIERAWAWFQGALAGLMGLVRAVPAKIISTITSLTIQDIVTVAGAFTKIVSAFANIAIDFISWGIKQVISLLEILFSIVAPGVMPYIKKAQAAFMTIIKNPIAFVSNLVKAGKQGFQMFASNILEHLKAALIKWITGPLGEAGVYIPQSFSLIEIVKLVLSVLGLTWQNIRSKLVKIIPEPVLVGLEKTAGILVTLVKDGPAAAWEQIKSELSELKDQMIAQVTEMISTEVVKAAIVKLVSMLNPAGAVVQAIIAIYNTVTFFIEKINQIGTVVESFIDSISAIANGDVGNAAKKVETTMANTLTIVIAFLAKFAGLGNIPNKVVGIVKKIRAPIDKGLDKIVAWLGQILKKLVGGVKSAAGKLIAWWNVKKVFTAGDGKKHTIFFRGEAANSKLMIASQPRSIEEIVEERKNLASPKLTAKQSASLKAALAKNKELDSFIKKNTSAPPDAANQNVQAEIDAKLELIKADLVAGDAIPASLTIPLTNITYQMADGRSYIVEARPLTNLPGNTRGSKPDSSPTSPKGWPHVIAIDGSDPSHWVRAHLVNENLHGPGRVWNVTPATQSLNAQMREGVEKDAKKAISAKPNSTILHYKATVTYNKDAAKTYVNDFPQKIEITWGQLARDDNDPQKFNETDKKAVSYTQGSPPASSAMAGPPLINDMSRRGLAALFDNKVGLAAAMLEAKKTIPGGKFNSLIHIMMVMNKYYQASHPNVNFLTEYWPTIQTKFFEKKFRVL